MKISLTWNVTDEITFYSNIFFSDMYYKITKIDKIAKYKLEFCEQYFCHRDFIIKENLDNLKQIAQANAGLLIYYYTLGESIITYKCMTIH